MDRVRNHYELERWIKPGSVLAPVQSGSSGSASEPPGHRATVPQRADAEILVDARTHQELMKNTLNQRSFRKHRNQAPVNPARTRWRNTTCCTTPAMPWCDVCIQSKGRDDVHGRAGPKVRPVIQLDDTVAGTHQGQATSRLHGWDRQERRRSLGINCFDQRQGGSIHCLIDPLMVVRARTFEQWSSSQTVRVRSRHAHGTVRRCRDGKSTV